MAVKYMIDYFYKFDYEVDVSDVPFDYELWVSSHDQSYRSDLISRIVSDDVSKPPYAALRSALEAHAFVYTLADKYDIRNLKVLAKEKFRDEAFYCTGSLETLHVFLKIVPFVYEHTAPGETGLRSCIVEAWREKASWINANLGDQNLRDLIERLPDLGTDLFTAMVDGHQPPSKRGGWRARRRGQPTGTSMRGGLVNSRGYLRP